MSKQVPNRTGAGGHS